MEGLTLRLLPFESGDGARNMAADEAILQSATAGNASLRFYTWSEPTLSLGYFQSHKVRAQDERLQKLPFVRRPSGGQTLVHHHELTYALALPADNMVVRPPSLLSLIHQAIAAVLRYHGVSAATAERDGPDKASCLCFQHITQGDILLNGHKIGGSAQRRRHGALLQHGAILLKVSPFTPALLGVEDLSRKVIDVDELVVNLQMACSQILNHETVADDWTDDEHRAVVTLVKSKYEKREWNEKR